MGTEWEGSRLSPEGRSVHHREAVLADGSSVGSQ